MALGTLTHNWITSLFGGSPQPPVQQLIQDNAPPIPNIPTPNLSPPTNLFGGGANQMPGPAAPLSPDFNNLMNYIGVSPSIATQVDAPTANILQQLAQKKLATGDSSIQLSTGQYIPVQQILNYVTNGALGTKQNLQRPESDTQVKQDIQNALATAPKAPTSTLPAPGSPTPDVQPWELQNIGRVVLNHTDEEQRNADFAKMQQEYAKQGKPVPSAADRDSALTIYYGMQQMAQQQKAASDAAKAKKAQPQQQLFVPPLGGYYNPTDPAYNPLLRRTRTPGGLP